MDDLEGVKKESAGASVALVEYDGPRWRAMSDEQRQYCIDKWTEKYRYTHMHLVVRTVEDMFFGEPEQIVYQADIARKYNTVWAAAFVENLISDISTLDSVYAERNMLVALLAKLFRNRAGIKIEAGDETWPIILIDIPGVGQCGWHVTQQYRELLDGLGEYEKPYNGHTTKEKYTRVVSYVRS